LSIAGLTRGGEDTSGKPEEEAGTEASQKANEDPAREPIDLNKKPSSPAKKVGGDGIWAAGGTLEPYNCLDDVHFDEALKSGALADAFRARTPGIQPPTPLNLKRSASDAGLDTGARGSSSATPGSGQDDVMYVMDSQEEVYSVQAQVAAEADTIPASQPEPAPEP
jgi:hypothetical protein